MRGAPSIGACVLAAATAACSTALEPAAAPIAGSVPPAHLRYARTDARRVELEAPGTPARSVDEEVLTWEVESHRLNVSTIVDETLLHVTWKHDGQTIVDGTPARPVVAQLMLDHAGKLSDVRGLEGSSEAIAQLSAGDAAKVAAEVFSPRNLRARIALAEEELVGGAAPSLVLSRKTEVVGAEPCGPDSRERCDRVAIRAVLDPRLVAGPAEAMIGDYARSRGADTKDLAVERAELSESGFLLIDPSTGAVRAARLAGAGHVVVTGLREPVDVVVRTSARSTFDYSG